MQVVQDLLLMLLMITSMAVQTQEHVTIMQMRQQMMAVVTTHLTATTVMVDVHAKLTAQETVVVQLLKMSVENAMVMVLQSAGMVQQHVMQVTVQMSRAISLTLHLQVIQL